MQDSFDPFRAAAAASTHRLRQRRACVLSQMDNDKGEWVCSTCTFTNQASASKCAICDAPKAGDQPTARASLIAAGTRRPVCLSVCWLVNSDTQRTPLTRPMALSSNCNYSCTQLQVLQQLQQHATTTIVTTTTTTTRKPCCVPPHQASYCCGQWLCQSNHQEHTLMLTRAHPAIITRSRHYSAASCWLFPA